MQVNTPFPTPSEHSTTPDTPRGDDLSQHAVSSLVRAPVFQEPLIPVPVAGPH